MTERLQSLLAQLSREKALSALYLGVKGVLAVRLLGVGLGFLIQLLLARWFGASVFGEYVFVITFVTVLALIAKLGLDTASLRYVSAYHSADQMGLLKGFVIRSRDVVFLVSVVISALAITLIGLISGWHSEGLRTTFQIGFLLLPCMVLMQLYAAQIQGIKPAGVALVPQDIIRPIMLGAGVSVFALLGYPTTASMIIGVDCVAVIGGAAVAWALQRVHLSAKTRNVKAIYRTKSWLAASFPMFMLASGQMVFAKADIIMIGLIVGPTQAGKYAVASLLVGLVTFFISTANQVIAPTISRLFVQKKLAELQRVITISTLALSALSLPFVICLLMFGSEILALFGEEFVGQYLTLLILTAGYTVIVLSGSVGFLLTMTQHQTIASWVIVSASIVNIVLNLYLIPSFGVVGAAMATSLSISVRSIILGFMVWKKLRIMPTVFGPILLRSFQS